MQNEFVRLKEVSNRLGLCTTTLRRMIKRKEIKAVLIGGNYYIRPNDYYEFLFNIECKRLGLPPEKVKEYFIKEDTKILDEYLKVLNNKQ